MVTALQIALKQHFTNMTTSIILTSAGIKKTKKLSARKSTQQGAEDVKRLERRFTWMEMVY